MARDQDHRAKIEQARERLNDEQAHILRFSEAIDPDTPQNGPKKSRRTTETYTDALRRFEKKTGRALPAHTTETVLDSFDRLSDELSENSISQYQSAVKVYYQWSDDHNVNPDDIAVTTPTGHAIDPDDILSGEQFHAMLDAAPTPRARAVVALLGFTGQRIRAIQTLRVRDVDPDAGATGRYWLNDQADGMKGADEVMRKRPLLGAQAAVRDWLTYHPTGDADDYLITTLPSTSRGEPGSRVAQNTIRRDIRKAANRADIDTDEKPVNPHAFRHFFATTALRNYDMEPSRVRALLGHGEGSRIMETTYRHLTDDDIISEVERDYGVAPEEAEAAEENPLTPPSCPTCDRALDGHKECPRCGERFGPDAEVADVPENLDTARTHLLQGISGIAQAADDPEDVAQEMQDTVIDALRAGFDDEQLNLD